MDKSAAAVFGALVADAAALGLHWLYDVSRLAEVAERHGSAAFVPVDAAYFDGAEGYFAHGARRDGQPTQYGAALRLVMATILRQGVPLDITAYQADYAGFFGTGGDWRGYIDRPTKGTLENLAKNQTDPSGVDDDQLPALATLPAVIVVHGGRGDLAQRVQAAQRVTNVNPEAVRYGKVFTDLLMQVLNEIPLPQALRSAAGTDAPLLAALDSDQPDSVVFGETTGRACHLSMGMPLAFHILVRSTDFSDAVERNIRAGGDSAGRAIVIGAVMGAVRGAQDIPLDWVLALEDGRSIWAECRALSAL